jgi:uncharacterized membrane protein YbaN (DUF454 family)
MPGHSPDNGDNRRQVRNPLVRLILIACGWLAIVAGVVGIFLPLLPTVPFLLLAAACFARSSTRFHRWLLDHNHLGPPVRAWLEGGGIPLRVKQLAIGMIWVSIPTSTFLFVRQFWLQLLLLAVAGGVTLYLLSLPVSRENRPGG